MEAAAPSPLVQSRHLVLPDGAQMWKLGDQLHREDGPALIEPDGSQRWYLHDQLHREDGPAAMHVSGEQTYWLHGVQYDPVDFQRKQQEQQVMQRLESLRDEELVELLFRSRG